MKERELERDKVQIPSHLWLGKNQKYVSGAQNGAFLPSGPQLEVTLTETQVAGLRFRICYYPNVGFATGQRPERQNANAKKRVARFNVLLVIG